MTRLLIALSFVAGLLVAPVVSASPAQAALPTTGGESTSFVIDGDSTGPDDWDAPYTAGLTPLGNKTTGMLPANFFPTFEAADFPDPSVTQVDNPAFGFFDNVPQYCEDTRGGPSEDGWLNPAGDGKLSSLRLENPAVSNNGNQILGCPSGSPQNKTNLLNAYAAFEIIEVPGTGGGSQSEYVLYGAWRRGDSETGELNFYIPVADGVDGPVDGSTYPTNTAGDRVIQFNFDNSGNFAFAIWGWDTGTGAWKVLEFIPPAATGTAIFDAAVGSGNGSAFGEFAINLTRTGILPDDDTAGCRVVEIADYVFTGTGNAETATLKDYVDGPGFPFTNCGSLNVEKTSPFTPADPEVFGYAVQQVDNAVIFPADEIPATVPPSKATALASTIAIPPPADPFPTDPQGNPQTFTPLIAQTDYQITEATPPDPWQLVSLECTYKDIFDPILGADGNPTGDFNTVTATYDTALTRTNFAIPPVLDVDGNLIIDDIDLAAFQADCVIVNDVNRITIVKDAIPDDGSVDFPFVSALGADPIKNFTLNDPNDPAKQFLVAQGEPNVFLEQNAQLPPYWKLDSIGCDVPDDDPQVEVELPPGFPEVIVTIGDGPIRDVTCTFTNKLRAPYQIVVSPPASTNGRSNEDSRKNPR